MNMVQRTVRALAVPALLLLACAGAWAIDHDEHKVRENQPEVNAESPAGLPFAVAGTEQQDPLTPTTPYVRKGTASPRVVAPPANLEEIRQQTGAFLDLLKANPKFQKRLDESLRRLRETGGASQ